MIDKKENTVSLLYDITDDIFEKVCMETANLGRNRVAQDNTSLIDIIAMTEDDKDKFDEYLEQAMVEVYKKSSSYISDYNIETSVEKPSVNIILKIPSYATEAMLKALDKTVLRTIIRFIEFKWLMVVAPVEGASLIDRIMMQKQ